jgi:hypothetical protein
MYLLFPAAIDENWRRGLQLSALGAGKQFSSALANSPVALVPFTVHALSLATIKLADSNIVWDIADDVAFHELSQPLEWISRRGTVIGHKRYPSQN